MSFFQKKSAKGGRKRKVSDCIQKLKVATYRHVYLAEPKGPTQFGSVSGSEIQNICIGRNLANLEQENMETLSDYSKKVQDVPNSANEASEAVSMVQDMLDETNLLSSLP